MTSPTTPLAALLLTLAAPAAARSGPRPDSAAAPDCAGAVARADRLNARALLDAAAACSGPERAVESAFLLSAGQVRTTVDAEELVPATAADGQAGAALYGRIFFEAGGWGDDAVLRAPASRARLFALLDGWSPVLTPGYDPGWKTRRRPGAAAYAAALAAAKAERRGQLDEVARLLSDDRYYALHRRRAELDRRTGGRYEAGSAPAREAGELARQMAARAAELGVRPPPGPESSAPESSGP